MKVYCVIECDLRTGETVLKSVFSTFKKVGIVGCVGKNFMGYKLPIMLVKEVSEI